MLKITNLILFLLCTIGCFGQEDELLISGTIINDESDLIGVHVINKSTNRGTITNENGLFSLYVHYKDTLVFRGIQFETKEYIITRTNIDNKSILVELITRTNVLNEITLKEPENMAKALNLPNARKERLSRIDRKLAYYNQGSTPLVGLATVLGRKGGIEDLYNIISGNRKKQRKLKQLIEADKQREYYQKKSNEIRKHFKDDFFIYTLKIPSKKIDSFIEYCKPKGILGLFKKRNYLPIIDVFIKESKPFLKALNDEN